MNPAKTLEDYPHTATIVAAIVLLACAYAAYLEYAGKLDSKTRTATIIAAAAAPALLTRKQVGQYRFAVPYLIACSLAFTTPVLKNFDYWGFHDWDYHTFIRAVERHTILEYRQIPYWNPYNSGGNIHLANWSSGFLSPFYLIILIFGVIHGVKIQLITHTFIGLFGFHMLSKHLGLSGHTAYLPGFIYMFSSFYSLHLAVGHLAWIASVWLPYVYLYYRMSYVQLKFGLLAGLFTALIYFEAHGYLFAYTILFIGLHSALKLAGNFVKRDGMNFWKKMAPLGVLFVFLAATFILGAVKLIPTLLFTLEYPSERGQQPGFTAETLFASLMKPESISVSVFWHNKSAYMGAIPVVLALIGAAVTARKDAALLITLLIIIWASFTVNAPVNLWELIHNLPGFKNLRAPTRLITVTVFITALLAGLGLNRMEKLSGMLPAVVVAYCVFALITANSPAFYNAFIIKPYTVKRTGADFQQVVSKDKSRSENSNCYAHFLANQGTINCYEPIRVKRMARDANAKDYRGEAYVIPRGTAEIKYFSPNRVVVETTGGDTVVLNQNYFDGWKANGRETAPVYGLIGAKMNAGERTVEFTYTPPGFYAGAVLTAAGLLITALALTGKIPDLRGKPARSI